MTNYEIKSRIAIMQAYLNGKQIQEYVDGKWVNIDEPEWKNSSEYRIKPEIHYRPFDNADECWNEMMKHQPFGIVKDKYYTNYQCKRAFTYLTMKGCNFRGYEDMTFESCFKNLIFDDGKPFGIHVSES